MQRVLSSDVIDWSACGALAERCGGVDVGVYTQARDRIVIGGR